MKTAIYFLGLALQIMGFLTVGYVFFLFFGKSGMGELLKMSLFGLAEFYGGIYLMKMTGRK